MPLVPRSVRTIVTLAVAALAILPGRAALSQDLTHAEAKMLEQFGADAMRNAESGTRTGTDLQKARYLFTKLCNRLSMHGERVNSTRLSRLGNSIVNLDGSRLTCSNLTNITIAVFHGAGIKIERTFEIAADKNSWAASLTFDPNRNHSAPCLIVDGKVYTFDAWQYAVHNTLPPQTFTGGGSSDWNGMPLEKWAAEMAKQGYVRFSSNAQEDSAGADRTRWHKSAVNAGAEAVAARRPIRAGRAAEAGINKPGATGGAAVKSGAISRGQWALVEVAGKDENQGPATCVATFTDTGLDADVHYVGSNGVDYKFHASVHWSPPPGALTPGETLRCTGTADNGTVTLPGPEGRTSTVSNYVVPSGAPGQSISLDFMASTRAGRKHLCWNVRSYRYQWVPRGEVLPDARNAKRGVVQ